MFSLELPDVIWFSKLDFQSAQFSTIASNIKNSSHLLSKESFGLPS